MSNVTFYRYSAKCISRHWDANDLSPYFILFAIFKKEKTRSIFHLNPYTQIISDLGCTEILAKDLTRASLEKIQPFTSGKDFELDSYYAKVDISELTSGDYLQKFMSKRFLDAYMKSERHQNKNHFSIFNPENSLLSVHEANDIEFKNPVFSQKIPYVLNRFGYKAEHDFKDHYQFLKSISKDEFDNIKCIGNYYEISGDRWMITGCRMDKFDLPHIVDGKFSGSMMNYGGYVHMDKTKSLQENADEYIGLNQILEAHAKHNDDMAALDALYAEWLPKVS